MALTEVNSLGIKDLEVKTADIAADAVTGAKIADDAIDSEHYTDASIDHAHLANDCVDGDNIADDAINSEHYVDASIDHAHLANDCVDGDNIADDSINSEHYADGSIDHAHLSDDCVDGDNIADNSVGLAAMAGLARGKIIYGNASGDPTALAVGSADQVLTSDGTDISWAAAAGGGIENIDTWYPPSNWTSSSGTTYMTSWNQATDTAYGHIGGDMSHSSGVFEFPVTGMWLVFFRHWAYRQNGSNKSIQNMIELTKNASAGSPSWAQYGRGSCNQYDASGDGNGVVYDSSDAYCVLDITSTSDCKVRFGVDTQAAVTHFGGVIYDCAMFIKLCDT